MNNNLFENAATYPNDEYLDRYNLLVGIDEHKVSMEKTLEIVLCPERLKNWKQEYHPNLDLSMHYLKSRPPLIVLEGDVGCGKTEMATTIGAQVAKQTKIPIILMPLSLSSRGNGMVGQMTTLISSAFETVVQDAKRMKHKDGSNSGGIILLIDEADALAQSRENQQMHHEDKAGVNAFLRGIDSIASSKVPVAVIMCTNRLNSLDPALKRRACLIQKFERPSKEQRKRFLEKPLAEFGLEDNEIGEIVDLTGSTESSYGFTYSDLAQRLIPNIILDAFPDKKISFKSICDVIASINPTKPFNDL